MFARKRHVPADPASRQLGTERRSGSDAATDDGSRNSVPGASAVAAAPVRSAGRLEWIEAGRGLAAMAVVCSHMPPLAHAAWSTTFGLGAMGVEFFFLLSGFIIFYIHRQEVGRPDVLPRYAWRRLGRIFSTYWLVFLIVLALDQLLVSPSARAHVDAAFLFDEVLLLPGGSLFIGPAWTLRHELLFYAMFATLLVDRRLGLAVFGLWAAGIIAMIPTIGLNMMPTQTVVEVAFHHYNLDFILGMATALAAHRGRETLVTIVAAVAGIVLLGAWLGTGMPATSAWLAFGYKALFLAVLGAAIMLSRGSIRPPAVAILLGSASYSIYLLNRDVGYTFARLFRRIGMGGWIDTWPAFTLSVAIAASAGLILYWFYEKPVLRWVNTRPWAKNRPAAG